MATRGALRTLVRAELNDAGAAQLWSDSLLNEWILEGIRDYGRALPREASQSLTSAANQADYALAADCQRVVRVEHPSGFFRLNDPLAGSDVVDPFGPAAGLPRVVSEQLAYEVWGAFGALTLTLRPAPGAAGEAIKVRYLGAWAEPSADGSELDLPDGEEHLLIWYAAWRALQWISTDESKRQRFERQRGVSAAAALGQYQREYRRQLDLRRSRTVTRRLAVRG